MATRRMIDSGIFTSKDLVDLPPTARWLWLGLIIFADDSGAIRDHAPFFRRTILFGIQLRTFTVKAMLDTFVERRMLEPFERDGERHYRITNFHRYQRRRRREGNASETPLSHSSGIRNGNVKSPGASSEAFDSKTTCASRTREDLIFSESSSSLPPSSSSTSRDVLEPVLDSRSSTRPEKPPSATADCSPEMEFHFARWNDLAKSYGLPAIRELGDARRKNLKLRLRELPSLWADVEEQLKNLNEFAKTSGFLSFDWLMKPLNLAKLLEGNYRKDRCPKPLPTLPGGVSRRSSYMNDPEQANKFDGWEERQCPKKT